MLTGITDLLIVFVGGQVNERGLWDCFEMTRGYCEEEGGWPGCGKMGC